MSLQLIITNVHLYLIQLWWQFFLIFVYQYGDVVFYTFWGVIDPEKLSSHLNAIIIFLILEILVANFTLKTKIIFHPWHHLSSLYKLPVILNISE